MAKTSTSKRRKNTQDSFLLTIELRYFRILSDLGTKSFEKLAKTIGWCDRTKWQFSQNEIFFLLSAYRAATAHCCYLKETSSHEVSVASEPSPGEHPGFFETIMAVCHVDSFRSGGRFIEGESGLAVAWTSHPSHPIQLICTRPRQKRWFSITLSISRPSHLVSNGAKPHSFSKSRATCSLTGISSSAGWEGWFRSWKTGMATKTGKVFDMCFLTRTQFVYLD